MADPRSVDDSQNTDDRPPISAHTCSAERTVFTESGNADAWIATDVTVDLRR